jgi:predicted secreted protein
MRNALLALVLLLALPAAGFAAPAGPRDDPPPPPGPAVTVLHVQETAEKSVVPDRLRVAMRVEESGSNPQTVQSTINRHMAAALATARQAAGVAVETGEYALFQETPANAPPRWRGSQSLILSSANAPPLLQLAGALQADGLVMSSLAYEVSPEQLRSAEQDLTAKALTTLGRRAAAIADQLNLMVLRYRDLTVGNAETGFRPVLHGATMAMAAPVAAPGRERIRLTVSADVILGHRPPGPPHP